MPVHSLWSRVVRSLLRTVAIVIAFGAGSPPSLAATAGFPRTPPAQICGDGGIVGKGPSTAPPGAISVPAGDNSGVDFGRAETTYWFAPGIHTLGSGPFAQIIPGDHSRFVGAPGAIIDGQHVNRYAFTQHAAGVTIEHLTIQNFVAPRNEGVVNHDSGHDWTIQYNTIQENAGAGLMIGTGNVVRSNCIRGNGQYGFNAYESGGVSNIRLEHNEIAYNNNDDWESKVPGCGCSGGGKFWNVTGATVTDNYVHHNHGVGLWADTNNAGFLIKGNYISENDGEGIFYEISYNARIEHNTLIRNALEAGPKNPGFPTGAIYISESGSDARVPTRFGDTLEITGNYLKDNWSGVVLWENADRFCGSQANTSTGACTRVNPGVVTASSCNAQNIEREPYFSDCRWKTQNVLVTGNVFEHTAADLGPGCTFNNHCGVMAILSNYGTFPDWSPYKGAVIQNAITHNRNNTWRNNTYRGDWRFVPLAPGNLKTFAQWQAPPYAQDAGSTLNAGER